jgi:predicted PurR-regulated permease PerM
MADLLPPTIDAGPVGAAGPSLSVTLTALMAGAIIAALYLAREIFVPIALAVSLSFLLAPAVRRLAGSGRPGSRRWA